MNAYGFFNKGSKKKNPFLFDFQLILSKFYPWDSTSSSQLAKGKREEARESERLALLHTQIKRARVIADGPQLQKKMRKEIFSSKIFYRFEGQKCRGIRKKGQILLLFSLCCH